MLNLNNVQIFIYASCHFSGQNQHNERIGMGGYGIVIKANDEQERTLSARCSDTTNARMDIMGITEGLKTVKEPSKIVVYSSNGYVIDTLTKGWLNNWKKNGFRNKKHSDLWIELDKLLTSTCHIVTFKHSKEVQSFSAFKLAESIAKIVSSGNPLPPETELGCNGQTNSFGPRNENVVKDGSIGNERPILDSICVDASTIGNPGPTEY